MEWDLKLDNTGIFVELDDTEFFFFDLDNEY